MKCYLCEKENLKVIRNNLRHNIRRNVLKCETCGLVFLEPKQGDLSDYYKEEYRKLYTPVIGKELDSKETFDIYLPFQKRKIDALKHILKPDMKVLDIGSSTGHFLYTMREHVGEVIGIEFNKENVEFSNKKLGIKTYNKPIEETDIPEKSFGLITIFHVLEHMPDPLSFLNTVKRYLKSDGFVCVEVPNVEDALIALYKSKAYADFWYREPHIFNYSASTLTKMMDKVGFTGKVKTVQRYNFLNHLHWLMKKEPQKSVSIGMLPPELAKNGEGNPIAQKEINNWFEKVSNDYKELLEKHNLGDAILFIGQIKNI